MKHCLDCLIYLLNRDKNKEVNGEVKSSKSTLIKTGYPNLLHGWDFLCFNLMNYQWVGEENEPGIAAPRLETNERYLWGHNWWASFDDLPKRFWGFREIIEFVSRIFWSLMTSQCVKEMKTLICDLEVSKYGHESTNHWNQAKIRS